MNENFLKIPNSYLWLVRANKDFLIVLLYLYMACDCYTQRGCFALAELMATSREKPTPARWNRLKKALALLVEKGILTLQNNPDIQAIKPRQLLRVDNFNYSYFQELDKGFVLIPNSHIRELLRYRLKLSQGNQHANVLNVYFEAMVRFDHKIRRTNFRHSALAESLNISVEHVWECVEKLIKLKIFDNESSWREVGQTDCIYLILNRKLKEER